MNNNVFCTINVCLRVGWKDECNQTQSAAYLFNIAENDI